ncbi:MAG: hypothetical protein DLM65_09025 [Candidatus Aeolococcus gillhamiae]|uniref:Uncharacterized protein n=1 Tax=Candidatus Aeolococcus gillhamiae TaxID=3127015 RepID=A0A2W6AQQ8_9BACT|nr:MAG: hypothetical protein DLM65_09025 [Candidatus Dormibacter sp. RRmetagenome_bin12]
MAHPAFARPDRPGPHDPRHRGSLPHYHPPAARQPGPHRGDRPGRRWTRPGHAPGPPSAGRRAGPGVECGAPRAATRRGPVGLLRPGGC